MPKVVNAKIQSYGTFLIEKYRSPSKGGNGRAWHSHKIEIEGESYSWRGLGFRQWIYKTDTVSFDWEWDPSRKYRNVDADSVVVTDQGGNTVVRGERGTKKWRTATQRAPVSRREWRD